MSQIESRPRVYVCPRQNLPFFQHYPIFNTENIPICMIWSLEKPTLNPQPPYFRYTLLSICSVPSINPSMPMQAGGICHLARHHSGCTTMAVSPSDWLIAESSEPGEISSIQAHLGYLQLHYCRYRMPVCDVASITGAWFSSFLPGKWGGFWR